MNGLKFGLDKPVVETEPREIARAKVKAELLAIIEKTVAEPRRTKLVALLVSGQFFDAPASSKAEYHGAWPGGLADHTLSILRHMASLNDAWECGLSDEAMVMSGIMHDIAKAGIGDLSYYIPQDSKWHQEKLGQKYKYNSDLPSIGQNTMSLYIAQKAGIELTIEEYEAVMGQDGLWTNEGKSVWEGRGKKPGRLTFVLHLSDWYTSAIHKV